MRPTSYILLFPRPFDIAIFCVPDSSRAAAATPTAMHHHQHHHPEWQLLQAKVFVSLLRDTPSLPVHEMSPERPLLEENAFAVNALTDGVAAGASRVMVSF